MGRNAPMYIPRSAVVVESQAKYADVMWERLNSAIVDFQKEISDDEEVGVPLASFGQSIVLHIDKIGDRTPELIIFFGRLLQKDGTSERAELLQHISQVNLLLLAVKTPKGEEPRRIGFDSKETAVE